MDSFTFGQILNIINSRRIYFVSFIASEWVLKDIVEFLLSKGAGVNDKDNDGSTPLHSSKTTMAYVEDATTKLDNL